MADEWDQVQATDDPARHQEGEARTVFYLGIGLAEQREADVIPTWERTIGRFARSSHRSYCHFFLRWTPRRSVQHIHNCPGGAAPASADDFNGEAHRLLAHCDSSPGWAQR